MEKAFSLACLSQNLIIFFKFHESKVYFTFYSDSVPALYGYNPDEFEHLKESDALSYLSEYDAEFIKKGLSRCIDEGEPYKVSFYVKHKCGNPVLFCGTVHYIGTENDCPYFCCALTENSGKENKSSNYNLLLENEKIQRKAIEFGNILIWDFDIENSKIIAGNIPFHNNEVEYSDYPQCMLEMGIIEPKDAPAFLNAIEKVKRGEAEAEYECWHHMPGVHNAIYYKVKYINEYGKDFKPVLARGLAIDLSEAKNAEINFEHRTNAVLRLNPDSLASFQVNISTNTCISCSTAYNYLHDIFKCTKYDELTTSFLNLISDKNERMHFSNSFSRGNIISAFNAGVLQVKLEHHIFVKDSHEEWVRTIVDIVKNPVSGDIEGVLHMTSIHHSKTIDSLINGTVQREFDYIALAYIKTNSFVMIDRFNHEINEESPEFIGYFREHFIKTVSSKENLDMLLAEFSTGNLVDKINSYGEYTIQYNTSDDFEKNRHKILRFSFLNSRKDIISVSCRDTTRLYNEELTQKKKISDALYEAEKANRAKSDFLSLVSHDIRTPLNGIMGNIQLALKEKNSEKVTKYLEKTEMSSAFLLGLINDLLDMSKIESGKVELKPEIFAYSEFNEYINSVIRPLCKKKNITLSVHVNGMVPYIYVDKLRFYQIMFNLLSNACKYTNEGGKVSLKVNSEIVSESLCICTFIVKDNGIGMSEEFQEHLFDTFAQENRMNFNSNEGTGLGLSITRSLVELMGGEIFVDSVINEGTTFTVQLTFPYFNKIEEEKDETLQLLSEELDENDDSPVDYSGCTFLLCEDNVINQEIATEIIKSLGAEVDVADDGRIGVNKFSESPEGFYKAIFMDIRMPNLDGLSASKEIRNLRRSDAATVPIIAMTANAMSEDKMECIEAGMNSYLAKPIDINQLYKTMRRVIS